MIPVSRYHFPLLLSAQFLKQPFPVIDDTPLPDPERQRLLPAIVPKSADDHLRCPDLDIVLIPHNLIVGSVYQVNPILLPPLIPG